MKTLTTTTFAALLLALLSPSLAAYGHDTLVLELGIEGTDVVCEPFLIGDQLIPLPTRFEGDLIGSHGWTVGDYEEDLNPIIHPDFGFVGTTGTSTFTFRLGCFELGTIVTENLSLIVGIEPTGALLVESEGVVVNGTGIFTNATGALLSSSSVLLDLIYCSLISLETDLSLFLSFP